MPLFREYEYDKQPFVRSLISVIACLIIGFTLIFASTGKLAGVGDIPGQTEYVDRFITELLITPETAYFVGFIFIPWILPIAELIIGLLLVIGIWPRAAAICFLPLVFGFMANNSYMIANGIGQYPTCECFASGEIRRRPHPYAVIVFRRWTFHTGRNYNTCASGTLLLAPVLDQQDIQQG